MKGNTIMTINHASNTIELTQKDSKAAGKYNSDAYHELLSAKKDFPEYRVVIVRPRKRTSAVMRGLTYEYMKDYITKHPKEDAKGEAALIVFYRMQGRNEGGKKMEHTQCSTYGEVMAWFLELYPEITEFNTKVQEQRKVSRESRMNNAFNN